MGECEQAAKTPCSFSLSTRSSVIHWRGRRRIWVLMCFQMVSVFSFENVLAVFGLNVLCVYAAIDLRVILAWPGFMKLLCVFTYLTHMLPGYVDPELPNVAHLVNGRPRRHHTKCQRQPQKRLQQHQILHIVAELMALHREAEDRRVDADGGARRREHQPAQRRRLERRKVEERRFRRAYVGFLLFHLRWWDEMRSDTLITTCSTYECSQCVSTKFNGMTANGHH